MGAIGAAIGAVLLAIVGSLVGRAVSALFIGYFTYEGIGALIESIGNHFVSGANGLPADILGIMGLLKIGTVFNILTSAVTAKLTLSGLKNGSITKVGIKK